HVGVAGRPTPAGVVALGPDAAATLVAALARAVPALLQEARDNQHQGDTTDATLPGLAPQKQEFYDEARAERTEAQALGHDGPCVYAVVVSGTLAQLARLA